MKEYLVGASLLMVLTLRPTWADFGGPVSADNAASPDGNLVVRIVSDSQEDSAKEVESHLVRYYQFDSAKDAFVRQSEFRLREWPGELLFLSNAGDLVMISLGEKDAIRLYARNGNLVKTWSLNELLTPAEIEACAQTGSTLQWVDEGAFQGRSFYFTGPSHRIRALQPPFTIMRGTDSKVRFSGSLNAENGTLRINKQNDP